MFQAICLDCLILQCIQLEDIRLTDFLFQISCASAIYVYIPKYLLHSRQDDTFALNLAYPLGMERKEAPILEAALRPFFVVVCIIQPVWRLSKFFYRPACMFRRTVFAFVDSEKQTNQSFPSSAYRVD
jgi:hypothetical protein